jgi:mRNA interferase MazF
VYDHHPGAGERVVLEPGIDPIGRPTAVNPDSVENVSLAALVGRAGRLSDQRMGEVCAALEIVVDCTG